MDLSSLLKEDLVAKVRELERVLQDFQELLKELEQALEEELEQQERENTATKRQLAQLTRDHEANTRKVFALTTEKNTMVEHHLAEVRRRDDEVRHLRSQLVTAEISNDDFETHDRVLQEKLRLQTQFTNDLLEKIALVELDLDRERRKVAEVQLHALNLHNEAATLRARVARLEDERRVWAPAGDPDTLVVLLSRVLDEGPPGDTAPGTAHGKLLTMAKLISHDVAAFLTQKEGMKPSKLSRHLHEQLMEVEGA